MNWRRGLFRLWIIFSIIWIGYAGWDFSESCTRNASGELYCPTGYSDWIQQLQYFGLAAYARLALRLFGVPMVLLIVGLAAWWIMIGFRRR